MVSNYLPRVMLIMQRTGSWSFSRDTRGNINLSNTLPLPMFRRVFRMFRAKGLRAGCRTHFVVGGKISRKLRRPLHLKKVCSRHPYVPAWFTVTKRALYISIRRCRWEAVADLNRLRRSRVEYLERGYDVSYIL